MPVFVAILVWLIRILLIGLLSMAGERLFTFMEQSVRAEQEARTGRGAPTAQPRPASTQARLPTADWAGGSRPASTPARAAARVIGNSADDGGTRANTVAERHGYGRYAQNSRPAHSNPPPPANTVRPAPKPSAATGQTASNSPVVRPIPARVGNGNGNGHSRNNDFDFDD